MFEETTETTAERPKRGVRRGYKRKRTIRKIEKRLSMFYEKEADVMYLFTEEPAEAKTLEVGKDFLLKINPQNGETVGLTILSFSKHFKSLRTLKDMFPRGATKNPSRFMEQLVALQSPTS